MPARSEPRRRTPAPVSEGLERLGERLRKARTEAGLSQSQLGAPHFTRAYISALELGKIRPAMKSLEFLAARLGKSVAHFVDDEKQVRQRRERDLDINAAATLLARSTAGDALQKVNALLENATTPDEIARLRLMAGTAHNFLAHGRDALRELTIADKLLTQMNSADGSRAVRHQMAIALRNLGELDRARSLLLDLLHAAERSDTADRVFRMKLLRDLGVVSWELGEYEKASAYYESALEWAKDIGDVSGLIAIYNGLAYAHRALGDLEGATTYLQRALGASQIANDLAASALLHNALAVFAGERGHLESAYRHVDRAIELARVTGPESYVAHYLTTKAECALKSQHTDDAERFALEALETAERTQNGRAAAGARVVLADVAHRVGRIEAGVARLEEAAASYRSIGAKQELGEVLMRLSRLARDQGDADRAQAYADQAFKVTKATSALMGG
ncbi:MAG: tetratricopeptide repeat protein [Chloroflexi bacterium]|nr:tetratricopeptide repeat protein [Chloroflexota bacterium]